MPVKTFGSKINDWTKMNNQKFSPIAWSTSSAISGSPAQAMIDSAENIITGGNIYAIKYNKYGGGVFQVSPNSSYTVTYAFFDTADNPYVIVNSNPSILYKLNPSTGAVVSQLTLSAGTNSSAIVIGDFLYYGANALVAKVNLSTMTQVWSKTVGTGSINNIAVDSAGNVVCTETINNKLHKVSADGTTVMINGQAIPASTSSIGILPIDSNNDIYINVYNNNVIKLTAASNYSTQAWSVRPWAYGAQGPNMVIDDDGRLVLIDVNTDRYIVKLDTATGATLFTPYYPPTGIPSPSWVRPFYKNKSLYVGYAITNYMGFIKFLDKIVMI